MKFTVSQICASLNVAFQAGIAPRPCSIFQAASQVSQLHLVDRLALLKADRDLPRKAQAQHAVDEYGHLARIPRIDLQGGDRTHTPPR